MKNCILIALCLITFMYTPEFQPQSRKPRLQDAERHAIQEVREEKRERPTEAPDRKDRNINIPAPSHEPPVQTPPSYTPPADPTPVYDPARDNIHEPVIHSNPAPVIIDGPGPQEPPYTPEVRKKPTQFDLYSEQGIEYFDSGYYEKALIEFDNAMSIDSTDYTLYYYRGCTLLKLDYFADAISDLNIYIMYFPEDKDAFYNRGLAWFYMDNKSIARDDFEAASKLGDKKAKAILKRFF